MAETKVKLSSTCSNKFKFNSQRICTSNLFLSRTWHMLKSFSHTRVIKTIVISKTSWKISIICTNEPQPYAYSWNRLHRSKFTYLKNHADLLENRLARLGMEKFSKYRNHKGHPQDLAEQEHPPYVTIHHQGPNIIMLDPSFTLNIVKTNKG